MSYKKIVENVLKESSLSRLWEHNTKHDCGGITAFRKGPDCGKGEEYTKKENKQRNMSLVTKLKRMGYGITKVKGVYPEGGKPTTENSYFVVDIKDSGDLRKDLVALGKEFEQDSILFVPKGAVEGDAKALLVGTNTCPNNDLKTGKTMEFEKGVFGKSSPFYTSYVNGRPFIFEDVRDTYGMPGNGLGYMAMASLAKMHWTELGEYVDVYEGVEEPIVEGVEYSAYWIDPKGKVIPVPQRHINTIIDEPKKFGLTTKEIEAEYAKYDEPMGHEGQARENIMLDLMKKGWIRLRFLPRNYRWTVQTYKLNKKSKDAMWSGFAKLVKKGGVSETHDIIILVDDKMDVSGEVGDLIDYSIFESYGIKGDPEDLNSRIVFIEDYIPDV